MARGERLIKSGDSLLFAKSILVECEKIMEKVKTRDNLGGRS